VTQAEDLTWFDVRGFGVEGKGWTDTTSYYDRLPAKAEAIVRPGIWELSHHSTGLCTHFETDAPEIWARWQVANPTLSLMHMPASGVSGLDLYAHDGQRWRWAGVSAVQSQTSQGPLITNMAPQMRRFRLYLPLYNALTRLEVGVPPGATLTAIPPRQQKAIVYYGTSIVHGGCASRPGQTHAAILGRKLDWPMLNLGFSGSAVMEPEIAGLLAELDPVLYVIDPVPNMNVDLIRERAVPFIRTLRSAHSSTPIVLVEARRFGDSWLNDLHRDHDEKVRLAWRAVFDQLSADGVAGLTYVSGEHLFGDDGEGTVDSSHPTDMGFTRMAAVLEPVLRTILYP
jgi:hypothetical protein